VGIGGERVKNLFLGEYEYHIDEKGRVAIPSRFREEFKGGLVLTQGLESCVIVYPPSEWKRVSDNLAALPTTQSKARRINRATFSTAFNLELDRLGRIALPSPLRQYAEIKDTVIIAGVNTYLELWSKENWEQEKALMNEQAWQISESTEIR